VLFTALFSLLLLSLLLLIFLTALKTLHIGCIEAGIATLHADNGLKGGHRKRKQRVESDRSKIWRAAVDGTWTSAFRARRILMSGIVHEILP
jgi:hypothetical protein